LRKRIDEWIVKDSPQADELLKKASPTHTVTRPYERPARTIPELAKYVRVFFRKKPVCVHLSQALRNVLSVSIFLKPGITGGEA
jgi:hypothetical protein